MLRQIFLPLLAAIFFAPVSQASTLTFDSVISGDDSSWTLTCSDCTMLAFLDNDGEAYASGMFALAGTLGPIGSAFTPVTGGSANPALNGKSNERVFLEAVATAFGDSPISGSFQKTESTSDPNTGPGTATNKGDYFLWKAAGYAGVAKILEISLDNTFTFSGSNTLSHIAHISTSTQQVPVPLPAGLLLLLTGLGVFAVIRRRAN